MSQLNGSINELDFTETSRTNGSCLFQVYYIVRKQIKGVKDVQYKTFAVEHHWRVVPLGLSVGLSHLTKERKDPFMTPMKNVDTQEILKIFDRDRYWLLSSEDYSPEYMLKHRAPNQFELQYMGVLRSKYIGRR